MSLAEEYRRQADECVALASRTSDPSDKARLWQMAQVFRDLAAKRAKDDKASNE